MGMGWVYGKGYGMGECMGRGVCLAVLFCILSSFFLCIRIRSFSFSPFFDPYIGFLLFAFDSFPPPSPLTERWRQLVVVASLHISNEGREQVWPATILDDVLVLTLACLVPGSETTCGFPLQYTEYSIEFLILVVPY